MRPLLALIGLAAVLALSGGCKPKLTADKSDPFAPPEGPTPIVFIRITVPEKFQADVEEPLRKAAVACYSDKTNIVDSADAADLEVHIRFHPYYGQKGRWEGQPEVLLWLRVTDMRNKVVVLDRRVTTGIPNEGKQIAVSGLPPKPIETSMQMGVRALVTASPDLRDVPLDFRPGTDGVFHNTQTGTWKPPFWAEGKAVLARSNRGKPKGLVYLDVIDGDFTERLGKLVEEAGWDLTPTPESADVIVSGEPMVGPNGEKWGFFGGLPKDATSGVVISTQIRIRARNSDIDLLTTTITGNTAVVSTRIGPYSSALGSWQMDFEKKEVKKKFLAILQQVKK